MGTWDPVRGPGEWFTALLPCSLRHPVLLSLLCVVGTYVPRFEHDLPDQDPPPPPLLEYLNKVEFVGKHERFTTTLSSHLLLKPLSSTHRGAEGSRKGREGRTGRSESRGSGGLRTTTHKRSRGKQGGLSVHSGTSLLHQSLLHISLRSGRSSPRTRSNQVRRHFSPMIVTGRVFPRLLLYFLTS